MFRSVLRSTSFLAAFTTVFYVSTESFAQDYSMDEVYQSAVEAGKSITNYWLNSGKNIYSNHYADGCAFYGTCIFGDALGDSSYQKKLVEKYTQNIPYRLPTGNVDSNAIAILPLHLYLHSENEDLLNKGIAVADDAISQGGYKRNAIDDTYMIGSLMVQAYRATNEMKYIDFCADYLTYYMDALQQDNGLYKHGANNSPQLWGRGNGWGAASAAELLRVIPTDHEKYNDFIDGYKKHMQGLIDAQWDSGNDNGMWPQVLLYDGNGNWAESSGTSMFLFALFTGLEMGVLDKETFLEPAMRGWMAVKGKLGSDGRLGGIASGFWPSPGGPVSDYLNAHQSAGDAHGTAGFMWAATAIIRYHNMIVAAKKQLPHISGSAVNAAQSVSQLKVFDLKGRTSTLPTNGAPMSLSTGMYIQQKNNVNVRALTIVP